MMFEEKELPYLDKLTDQGKTVQVELWDRCESCAYGDLDLSPAAFDAIADRGLGRIEGIAWQIGEFDCSPSSVHV